MPMALFATPLGPIGLRWTGETLLAVDLEPPSAVADAAAVPPALGRQLSAYFADGAARFEVPLQLCGTSFQRRVWAAIRAIPAGTTRTYADLARDLGSAPRAVGQACRANPCPIVVPCHRVVAVRGLGGFAGERAGHKLALKRQLLRHEGVAVDAGGD
ncbi:methylated-DNA--[protein]-cysteine S-methyltransferase [Candidatus Thiodictyon syntrophicum]|jgi:methylated-DNA-[protein]-cysteine S-methyltransferase|uniref:methylated-DNA--[protein]-cysteine S-methyltransferase n=1 Tax=Candidatus Thiodictyon syntrophicum TaxID=1166950 RepID=A0A2K8UAD4_9GAMM|nr:methylated-DNA--[protein]-cysteine S-methyltransferase [Candidatus Thiodictyon syntrophicum]AUB82021.1 cysteine methyltransferase [Candidatus Thiodictyon syntrophicum]